MRNGVCGSICTETHICRRIRFYGVVFLFFFCVCVCRNQCAAFSIGWLCLIEDPPFQRDRWFDGTVVAKEA